MASLSTERIAKTIIGMLWAGVGVVVIVFTWPICLACGGSAFLWWATSNSKDSPAKSAINGIFGPMALGLFIPLVFLLIVNVSSAGTQVVNDGERALVFLDNRLPAWTKPSFIVYA